MKTNIERMLNACRTNVRKVNNHIVMALEDDSLTATERENINYAHAQLAELIETLEEFTTAST